MRPSPSLSNLRVHSYSAGSSTVVTSESAPTISFQPAPNPALDSTASSVVNLDLNEGILIQDVDAETDTADGEEINVMGIVHSTDEASKKSLRDQLRRTLSNRPSRLGKSARLALSLLSKLNLDMISSRARRKGKQPSVHEIAPDLGTPFTPS